MIPSPIKASLATSLLEKWGGEGSDRQVEALRMSLGLDPPSSDFWAPVSLGTKALPPRDKIHFLGDVVWRFGRSDQAHKLQLFPALLAEVSSVIITTTALLNATQVSTAVSERLGLASDAKIVQQFSTDLLVSDFLNDTSPSPGASSNALRVLKFVREIPSAALEAMVSPAQEGVTGS